MSPNHRQNLKDHKTVWENRRFKEEIMDRDRKYELYCNGCGRTSFPSYTEMMTLEEARIELSYHTNGGIKSARCPWCNNGNLNVKELRTSLIES